MAFSLVARSVILPVLTLSFGTLLSGCGFKPLYGIEAESGQTIQAELASVRVGGIAATRDIARWVGVELDEIFTESAPSRYTLQLRLGGSRFNSAEVQGVALQRFDYTLSGRYDLIEQATGKTVLSEGVSAVVSYNETLGLYGSYVAEEDSVRRAATVLARQIELEIGLYLADATPQKGFVFGFPSAREAFEENERPTRRGEDPVLDGEAPPLEEDPVLEEEGIDFGAPPEDAGPFGLETVPLD